MAREINGAMYDCYSYPSSGIDTKKYYYYVLREGTPNLEVDQINDMIDDYNYFLKNFYVTWHDSVMKFIERGYRDKTMSEEQAQKKLFALEMKFPRIVEQVQQETENGKIYINYSIFNPKTPEAYKFDDMYYFFSAIYDEFCKD